MLGRLLSWVHEEEKGWPDLYSTGLEPCNWKLFHGYGVGWRIENL